MTLYEQLKMAQCQTDNHYSDLYVKDTPNARAIFRKNRTPFRCFVNNLDNDFWFEVPFAYDPFWVSKAAH